MSTFQFIQHQDELTRVLDKMGHQNTYALDTEFIKVDTLWPKLGLFQINFEHEIFLLDGTTLDLSAFWTTIANAKQNIFHACSEDIDLIYYYSGKKPLQNVFDTQLALSFLGYGLQTSYQNALKDCLGIHIEKDQTRSDWTQRPLSDEQLLYAVNDVAYLPELADHIKQALIEKNLLGYVEEDCSSLARDIAKETPIKKLYTDVANYRHSRRQLMQLQQLCVWRDQLVKAINIPKSFVIKNNVMIELVEKSPKNHFQLASIQGLRPSTIREYGSVILDLLKNLPPKDEWPSSMARPVKFITKEVSEKIDALIDHVAEQTQVPRAVLMRKKWLSELYHHVVLRHNHTQHLSSYLTGWRYELLVVPLLDLLRQDEQNLAQQMKNSH